MNYLTREEILRMIKESGMAEVLDKYDGEYGHDSSKEMAGFAELQKFAILVADISFRAGWNARNSIYPFDKITKNKA